MTARRATGRSARAQSAALAATSVAEAVLAAAAAFVTLREIAASRSSQGRAAVEPGEICNSTPRMRDVSIPHGKAGGVR